MIRKLTPFGRLAEQLRAARGMSLSELAQATFYSKTHIHAMINGDRAVTADAARRIDDALQADGALIALVHQPGGDTATDVGNTNDMHRRTVLTGLAALGLTHSADRHALSQLVTQSADRTHVDDWSACVREYGYTYLTADRTGLLADLTADLGLIEALLSTAKGSRRAGLAEAAARLAGLLAMACTDLGYRWEARHGWHMARRLADQSGSIACQLWIRGQEATLGLYSGRPLPLVLSLAEAGIAMRSGDATGGRAELLAARAQALVRLGRGEQAVAALPELRATFDALPDDVTALHDSAFGWPEFRLRHTESYIYASVGSGTRAEAAHSQALGIYPESRAISRCQIQLHRAIQLVRSGTVRDGVDHASATLAALPSNRRGRFVLGVAEAVLSHVPEKEASRPYVLAYREQLAA